MVERKRYLSQLIERMGNGRVKVITGIRRSGKSFLLFEIFHGYLRSLGVDDGQIVEMALDDDENAKFRNPILLGEHIRGLLTDKEKQYYVFLDEIQLVKTVKNPHVDGDTIGFVDVLLGLIKKPNVDVYVTGSNSKMLSSDILTEFRGRGDEIRVYPLSFAEFYNAYVGDKRDAWAEYFTYGGMPYLLRLQNHQAKRAYLQELFDKIYIDDILNRQNIKNDKGVLDDLLDVISSSVGSLTNPLKISNTFATVKKKTISDDAIAKYLDYFVDSFMIDRAQRYDIKGRKYIGSPLKYYYSDVGLRNVRLNFRQTEENHIMENILYNELCCRGFSVDVGIVEYNYKDETGKSKKANIEIDFVANRDGKRYYIQSALTVAAEDKRAQEIRPYQKLNDSFKKIVVVKDNILPWHDEKGVLYIGIEKFLLDETAIDY